jgi:hypothetical protein
MWAVGRHQEIYQELLNIGDAKVRYERSGVGESRRFAVDAQGNITQAEVGYSIIVEGTVCGWEISEDCYLVIAGYGKVEYRYCTVIE